MILIATLLLGLPGLGLFCLLAGSNGADGRPWFGRREAFAVTCVVWAVFSVAAVELLSLGAGHDVAAGRHGHLTRGWLLALWLPVAVAGGVSAWRFRAVIARLKTDLTDGWLKSSVWMRACLATIVACVAIVGAVALLAAPNNWDSMTYHLARVVAWIRLGGVAHYATNVEPQLYQPPGAEMLIAQWQLLTGGDLLAASVQWFAFAGSAVTASLAAARLGAARVGQIVAALLVVTTPMAIMQGSSTQNDLLTGFWLLIAATLALGVSEFDDRGDMRTLAACLAVGLAVLTKGTALMYGLPVIALIAACTLRRGISTRRVAVLAAGAALVIAPNVQHLAQNHATYGSFLATGSGGNFYKNENAGPRTILSNAVRNASVHLNLPSEPANRALEKSIRKGLKAIGADPDDPANTFEGRPFEVGKFGPHEDHAGNLALLLLSIWAVGMVAFVGRYRTRRRLAWAGVLCVQALLFCVLLKWQAWHARLHLPMFVLAAPLVAVCLETVRRRRAIGVVLTLITLAAVPYLFYNYTRPLVGGRSVLTTPRDSQYFLPRRNIEAPYRGVLAAVRQTGERDVGLIVSLDDWVYAFHALAGDGGPRFREVSADNRSRRYATTLPDLVVCVNCFPAQIADLQSLRFKPVPFTIGPVTHDRNLDESGVAMTLWRRK
ncbi:MAG: glycosyltransferase family 39 protein [Actinobacteria bacterium]|nr:glycosyltransferase family 39 protein [Actinomycetota bacterium]